MPHIYNSTINMTKPKLDSKSMINLALEILNINYFFQIMNLNAIPIDFCF